MNRILLALSIFACIISSCKKDDNDPINLLTSKKWVMALKNKNPSTDPKVSFIYSYSDCSKDDTFTFEKNGKAKINNGKTLCSANEPKEKEVNYSLDYPNRKLVMDGITYVVAELSTDQLKIYPDLPTYAGFGSVVVILLEH